MRGRGRRRDLGDHAGQLHCPPPAPDPAGAVQKFAGGVPGSGPGIRPGRAAVAVPRRGICHDDRGSDRAGGAFGAVPGGGAG
ncbi:MAG: hypothetical protein EGR72_06395 [Clostridiales bacterium]|nr:hypothetical protein [Clostridiales bacterium]